MKILVVDDELHVRRSMANMIRQVSPDYEVQEAEDGEDALEELEMSPYDLVITDLRMPGVDGLTLSKRIYEQWRQTAVIMLTGYAEFDYAQSALRYGVKEYLLKPASAEQIHEAIERIAVTSKLHKQSKEVGEHHTRLLIEKRVQDLFYELPLPYYDEPLFDKFEMIIIFSFSASTPIDLEKATRFAIKNVATDVLQQYGTPVVIVGDQAMTAVLFIADNDVVSEDDMDQMQEKLVAVTKQTIKINLRISFGGTTTSLSGISKLYEKSVKPFLTHEPTYQTIEKRESDEVHHIVREALTIINERYAKDLTLTSIASELFVSPNYLSGLFKVETGSTFTHHLTKARMEQAKRWLVTTNKKIYQICEGVGYGDQAHFSRVFKALEGMSPYEYRSKANF